ncbi:hypothetical protein DY000_02055860 [Brassica cretica]|uniref:BRCT domain-containing protein n=1 Tax=Brassica cretica TaxID=69181 RepID=A0ABQ7AIV0_BRACR|nr:hypothetical protein DY000_02055860 [Brassica cretica]
MTPRSLNGFRDHYVDTAAEESEFRKKEGREVVGEWKQLAQRTHVDCKGKTIPIRNFSSSQILKATKNFDCSCHVLQEGFYICFFTYFILIPPSSFNVREKIAEVGGEVSRMRRNFYMIQSKGYTSELEELDSR